MPAATRRLLFIRTDRLGETILNLPTVAALKAALPQASLTLLVHPDLQGLLERVPEVDRVMGVRQDRPRCWWARAAALGWSLRPHRFDVAVVSNPQKELHAAVWLAGIPVRVGYDRKWGGLLTHRIPDGKALGERHEVEYNLDLIRVLGLRAEPPAWQFPRFQREQDEVTALLQQQGVQPDDPLMAIHPWTSNPQKQWPVARYRQLMERIAQHVPVTQVLIGGVEYADAAPHVMPARAAAPNLVGRLSLTQAAALLQRARLLVSNDSGPVHLAAAVGTPVVALFGTSEPATGPRRWGPWGSGHRVIWKPSIDSIQVDEVAVAIESLLGVKPVVRPLSP